MQATKQAHKLYCSLDKWVILLHIGEATYFVIGGPVSSSLKFVLLLHCLCFRDHPNVAPVAHGASLLSHPESGRLLRMVWIELYLLRIHHHVRALVYFAITLAQMIFYATPRSAQIILLLIFIKSAWQVCMPLHLERHIATFAIKLSQHVVMRGHGVKHALILGHSIFGGKWATSPIHIRFNELKEDRLSKLTFFLAPPLANLIQESVVWQVGVIGWFGC